MKKTVLGVIAVAAAVVLVGVRIDGSLGRCRVRDVFTGGGHVQLRVRRSASRPLNRTPTSTTPRTAPRPPHHRRATPRRFNLSGDTGTTLR